MYINLIKKLEKIVTFGLIPKNCIENSQTIKHVLCSLQEMFDATLKDREQSFDSAPGTTMFLHWLVGMVYVFYFASFILLLREVSGGQPVMYCDLCRNSETMYSF